jgi:phage shock protein C
MEKKLYRSNERAIAGVCNGIGEYLNIEPILVQVIFFGLIWTPIPIIMIYIFLWLFMKKEPEIV